jgi:hypothetical protein
MRKTSIRLAFLLTLTVPTLFGCGGGGGGGGTESTTVNLSSAGASEMSGDELCDSAGPLPVSLQGIWNETQQCTALSSVPPQVVFSPTVVCPRNGQPDCLATVPFFPCSSDPSQTCGAIGRFLPSCNAIELPDRYNGAAAHEMIHYLLHSNGHDDWAAHSAPEFVCQ